MDKKTRIIMICLAFVAIVSLFFNILQFRVSGSMLKALNETPTPSATPTVTPTCSMDITQIPTATATATAVVTEAVTAKPTATVSSTPAPTAVGEEKLRYTINDKGEHFVIYEVYDRRKQDVEGNYTYRYIIKNNGKTVLDKTDLYDVYINQEENILTISTDEFMQFYDLKDDKLSDQFKFEQYYNSYDVFIVTNEAYLITYIEDENIVVRDIFNPKEINEEIKLKEEIISLNRLMIVNENEVYFDYYADEAKTKFVRELVNFNE